MPDKITNSYRPHQEVKQHIAAWFVTPPPFRDIFSGDGGEAKSLKDMKAALEPEYTRIASWASLLASLQNTEVTGSYNPKNGGDLAAVLSCRAHQAWPALASSILQGTSWNSEGHQRCALAAEGKPLGEELSCLLPSSARSAS